jgi:hypothetical protein
MADGVLALPQAPRAATEGVVGHPSNRTASEGRLHAVGPTATSLAASFQTPLPDSFESVTTTWWRLAFRASIRGVVPTHLALSPPLGQSHGNERAEAQRNS